MSISSAFILGCTRYPTNEWQTSEYSAVLGNIPSQSGKLHLDPLNFVEYSSVNCVSKAIPAITYCTWEYTVVSDAQLEIFECRGLIQE